MKKRAVIKGRKQEARRVAMSVAMQQLMLPLLMAMDATKKGLLSFVQQMGMVALSELLATQAEMIAGPKGRHIEGRAYHHWGTATTPVGFGGRHVSLSYPRVRARGKPYAFPVLADMVCNTLLDRETGREAFTTERGSRWATQLAEVGERFRADPQHGHDALVVLQAWYAKWSESADATPPASTCKLSRSSSFGSSSASE